MDAVEIYQNQDEVRQKQYVTFPIKYHFFSLFAAFNNKPKYILSVFISIT